MTRDERQSQRFYYQWTTTESFRYVISVTEAWQVFDREAIMISAPFEPVSICLCMSRGDARRITDALNALECTKQLAIRLSGQKR